MFLVFLGHFIFLLEQLVHVLCPFFVSLTKPVLDSFLWLSTIPLYGSAVFV